nr:hypothetical protein [Pandoravirus massiliensis]
MCAFVAASVGPPANETAVSVRMRVGVAVDVGRRAAPFVVSRCGRADHQIKTEPASSTYIHTRATAIAASLRRTHRVLPDFCFASRSSAPNTIFPPAFRRPVTCSRATPRIPLSVRMSPPLAFARLAPVTGRRPTRARLGNQPSHLTVASSLCFFPATL